MKIEKLILKNFRQYKDLNISLGNDDLYVLIGKMGQGKSNLLNSINWCLYEEEPFLSSKSLGLPILNLKADDESEEGDSQNVRVELWVKDGDHRLIFVREAEYIVHKDKGIPPTIINKPEIEVKVSDDSGNYDLINGEEANDYVERFVPSTIKEYFFFDGERLNRYFKETSRQRIKHAIYQISQTQLIGNIETRLSTIINELEKEAGRQNPAIEETRMDLENANSALDAKKIEIENCEEQIRKAKDNIDKCNNKLTGIPKIDELKQKESAFKKQMDTRDNNLKKHIKYKQGILFKYSKLIMAYPAIKKTIQAIEEKKKNNELPPTGDVALIKQILHNSKCICGTKIIEGSENENDLNNLLKTIEITSEVGKELQKIENPLIEIEKEVHNFKINIKNITDEIGDITKEMDYYQNEIDKIGSLIGGFDDVLVSKWYMKLNENEKLYKDNLQNVGVLKNDFNTLTKKSEEFQSKLIDEIAKDDKFKTLKTHIDFAQKSRKIAEECKNEVMDKIREEITNETSSKFLDLHWKSETFESVRINEDFEFEVNHVKGYPCLGTLSGGERCVLALSFTMALHNVSGFSSPILIDRPLAMASGEAMSHIADILVKLSNEKQIVLLLTPEDNMNVDKCWNAAKSYSKYHLKMDAKELTTTLEAF